MKLYLEIEAVPTSEGEEHPFSYFRVDLKEFLENFGWKTISINGNVEDEEDE